MAVPGLMPYRAPHPSRGVHTAASEVGAPSASALQGTLVGTSGEAVGLFDEAVTEFPGYAGLVSRPGSTPGFGGCCSR